MLLKVKEKKERSLGTKLFLKAERCNSPKCVTVRRPYRPGVHSKKRKISSEYGRQLMEKQKIQIIYGLNNRQLGKLFSFSKEKALSILERRLDRAVFYVGLAGSPRIARQLINHGHILVQGRRVTIPSYRVRIGDVISIRPGSRPLKIFEDILIRKKQFEPPAWLKVFPEELKGECIGEPDLDGAKLSFDINLVGEFYSR